MIILLGIPLLIISFFSVTANPSWLDFKPFNCNVCLSFWSTLIAFFLFPYAESIITAICIGGMASYVSIIAKRLIFKI